MLTAAQVPLTESALLVVDAQESFKLDAKRWQRRNNPNFERNVGALIDAYRAADLPVIFILHSDDDPGFSTDSPYYKLMDFISPKPGEPIVHKDTRNAFTSTNLQSILLHHGVRRVAITGIQMEQCCETTARVAADLGYAVDFVIDGTMTFPIPDPDAPNEELGVAAIEERTIYALRRRFARIVRASQLAAELQQLPAAAVVG